MEYGSFTYKGKRYPFVPDVEWNGGEIRAAVQFIGSDTAAWSQTDTMFAAIAVSIRRLEHGFRMADVDELPALELKAIIESIQAPVTAKAAPPPAAPAAEDETPAGVVLSPMRAGRQRKAAQRKPRNV